MAKLPQNMSSIGTYKIAILAAGQGTRLGELKSGVNKAMLPLGSQAVISHILHKFPAEIVIVMAVGYEKEKLQAYLSIAHPERTIHYVEVDKITGKGSGPGYSLLQCHEYLQVPFIFTTVDTLVEENIPPPDSNWFGVAPVVDPTQYNTVTIEDGYVRDMVDKVTTSNTYGFIGLAGVRDYNTFWEALAGTPTLAAGELQVSNGFRSLIEPGLQAREFTWFDTGNVEGYRLAIRELADQQESFDFSKKGEFLYFVGEKVIKYFGDAQVAAHRVAKARHMSAVVPKITDEAPHFYAYKKMPGLTMYQTEDPHLVMDLLVWLRSNLWRPLTLSDEQYADFRRRCQQFYYDKTHQRLLQYDVQTGSSDSECTVNGEHLPALEELLSQIDWQTLYNGIPSPFHGDLQFDNILVSDSTDQQFVLLDWRQDFAGLLEYGDLYYDLAKLNGGMLVPYHTIKKNMFSFRQKGTDVDLSLSISGALTERRTVFLQAMLEYGYDQKKIDTLTALIFLNMSPLHTEPFNRLLYYYGRLQLAQALQHEKVQA
ncbi:MAG: NTP transferase domain-containing protein [Candidatus Andersenbacteria bacterium]